jgi:hypothetical protein
MRHLVALAVVAAGWIAGSCALLWTPGCGEGPANYTPNPEPAYPVAVVRGAGNGGATTGGYGGQAGAAGSTGSVTTGSSFGSSGGLPGVTSSSSMGASGVGSGFGTSGSSR